LVRPRPTSIFSAPASFSSPSLRLPPWEVRGRFPTGSWSMSNPKSGLWLRLNWRRTGHGSTCFAGRSRLFVQTLIERNNLQ
jgi:hypothetical protein